MRISLQNTVKLSNRKYSGVRFTKNSGQIVKNHVFLHS